MDALQRVTAPTVDVLEQLVAAGEPVWGLAHHQADRRPAGTDRP